jgi:RHS repeat-associated protein
MVQDIHRSSRDLSKARDQHNDAASLAVATSGVLFSKLRDEADDATYRRFGVPADGGKLVVEYNDGSGGWRYPAELLRDLATGAWYTVSIVVDDSYGFYVEACQVDNPDIRGSYHTWMPAGQSWRFHHWIWSGNAYLDEYREFDAGDLDWSPTQYLAYDYDALDRLTDVAPYTAAWQGYTATYAYNVIGNITAWDAYSYGYGARPHAVTSVAIPPYPAVKSFGYDANGNLVTRTIGSDTYILSYDAENRLRQVKKDGAGVASFGYDGDGRMVTATVGVTTTYYLGNYFELVNGITHTYYYHAGKRIAMREGNTLYWLLTDHLGSTSMVVAATSNLTGELRYKAYGEIRDGVGITDTTKYHFTGQREEPTIGLYFYNARWYDAALGRFVQADPLVPEGLDPQNLNRYAYVLNNPLRYTDKTGYAHDAGGPTGRRRPRQPVPAPQRLPVAVPLPTGTQKPPGPPVLTTLPATPTPPGLPPPVPLLVPSPGGGATQIGIWQPAPDGDLPNLGPFVDAVGWRVEGTRQLPLLVGVDANVDLMFNLRARQLDLLIGWGPAGGINGGASWSTGLLIAWDCSSNDRFVGVDLVYEGANVPLVPLAVNLEAELSTGIDGSGPHMIYLGASPLGVGGVQVGIQAGLSLNVRRIPLLHLP